MDDIGETKRFFAVTAPGFEEVTAQELRSLGAQILRQTRGGVTFAGTLELGFRANLWLRTAVALRLRLSKFHAPSERIVAKRAAEIDWRAYFPAGEGVGLTVSVSRSGLRHEHGIEAAVREAFPPAVAAVREGDGQQVHVRVVHDSCTLSIDMSGELLHRRGYRQEISRGPLRETLAAGLILAAGWDSSTPFIDPMCGSGTLPIEAALIATRRAPGLDRRFACERWPIAPPAWESLRSEARSLVLPSPQAPILGSDRNAGAVGVARRNAERAGVAAHLSLERRLLADVEPPPGGPGLFLTNPPFGRRVTEIQALELLYAEIGRVLATRFTGWGAGVVSADPRLDRRIALERIGELEFRHGGLRCRLVRLKTGPP